VGVSLKPSVKGWLGERVGHHPTDVDSYLRFLPAVAYLGLDYVGVKAKHDLRDRLIAGATAYLAMGVLTEGSKMVVSESRPDGSDRDAFPSGHCAVAFTGAELMRIEYGNWAGLGGYAVATGVGVLRLCNRRHWANDLLAGAGIGILSARIGYWLLPLNRRWIRPNYNGSAVALLPTYSPYSRSYGLSASMTF
jgi:membrane-associated phospholipid phosphatase